LIDLGKTFRYVGKPEYGAIHDITILRNSKDEIENSITNNDEILLDKLFFSLYLVYFFFNMNMTNRGFMGFDRDATKGVWHIELDATKNRKLSREENERNDMIERFRRHIEMAFGDMKGRFDAALVTFRHDRAWLGLVFRFCCALHNLILKHQREGDNFSTTWDGPIPTLMGRSMRRVRVEKSSGPKLLTF
jgi:hypothetical protein